MNKAPATIVCTILLCAVGVDACASATTARKRVREGVAKFQRQDYDGAAKAFDDADLALPEDRHIAFNRACALLAQGDGEKARDLFQSAALSRDVNIAARSHYNLGCLESAAAKQIFGENPEEASMENRTKGLTMLAHAVGHYRDCLRIREDDRQARHNLEVIRQWMKHMQDLWAQRDRQKQREELNLLQFLELIRREQTVLRQTTKRLGGEDDSPRRRQAASQVESAQLKLAEEIEPLKQKITEQFQTPPTQSPPSAPNASPPQQVDAQQAIEVLSKAADKARTSMIEAASLLSAHDLPSAADAQTGVLDSLEEIYGAIVPYPDLLSRAVSTQQSLVDDSSRMTEGTISPDEEVDSPSPREADQQSDPSLPESDTDYPPVDLAEQQREQFLVQQWSQLLPIKAEQGLAQLQAEPHVPQNAANSGSAADSEQQAQQRKALEESMQKAIELSPRVHEFASAAVADLEKEDAESALPNQEEALKLLKEIAEPLPKQQNQQDQNQPGEDQEDQQDEQSQDGAGQNLEDQEDQPRQNEQQQSQRGEEQQQRQMTPQQAEALMSKVRERQREHQQQKKRMRGYLRGPTKVDRDW